MPRRAAGLKHIIEKRNRGRQDKAKTGEDAEFSGLNEQSEPVFNAVLPTQVVFHCCKRIDKSIARICLVRAPMEM